MTAVVVGGSVCALLQIAVVLMLWRFKRIRPTLDAVLSERIAEPGFGESVWAGLDRALAEPWDDDEVTAVADAVDVLASVDNDEVIDWLMWESEFGERAS